MAIHKDLTGADAIHPAAYIQDADPGAVGPDKLWIETSGAGTVFVAMWARDAADTGWIAVGGGIPHAASHENGGADEIDVTGLSGLLATAQTPAAHATSHKSGGSDAVKLDELAAPTDVATLNASTTAHGLLKKLSNVATEYMDGTGNYSVPAGGGGGSGRPLVDPTGLSWAWVNQGSATIATNGASLALNGPADASDSWRMRVKAVPAKPYTIIIHHKVAALGLNYAGGGVGWLQTSNNFFAGLNQYFNSSVGQGLNIGKSGTNYSFDAEYVATIGAYERFDWVKLTDAAAGSRTISVSLDGYNWILLHSVATDDFITPDRLYFGVNPRHGSYAAAVTIDSWEEL